MHIKQLKWYLAQSKGSVNISYCFSHYLFLVWIDIQVEVFESPVGKHTTVTWMKEQSWINIFGIFPILIPLPLSKLSLPSSFIKDCYNSPVSLLFLSLRSTFKAANNHLFIRTDVLLSILHMKTLKKKRRYLMSYRRKPITWHSVMYKLL